MELEFRGEHTNRPELGEYTILSRPTGRLEFSKPGAEILLKASSDTSEMPIPYSALPKTGYNQSHIYRNLVAELNEGPGIWKWPPTNPGLTLKSGMNDVRIEVATVAPELADESIMLLIHPEIGFQDVRLAGLLALGLVRLAVLSPRPVDLGQRPLQERPKNDEVNLTAEGVIRAVRIVRQWRKRRLTASNRTPDNPALMANVEMPVPQAAGWSAL